MGIVAIDSVADFNEKVLHAKQVCVVDFWAAWCTPCEVMRPEVEKVAAELDGKVLFFSVDAEDKNLREVLLREEVEGIPSMVFYRDGKQFDRIAGYKKADVLLPLIQEVVGK